MAGELVVDTQHLRSNLVDFSQIHRRGAVSNTNLYEAFWYEMSASQGIWTASGKA
jgi:hypothetical protein